MPSLIPTICARNRPFTSAELCHNQTDPLPAGVNRRARLSPLQSSGVRESRLRFLTDRRRLVAFLQQPINRGFDRLLISHRHRSDHHCELGAGRVRAQGEIEVSDFNRRHIGTGVLMLLKTSKLMAEYAARRLRL